MSDFFKGQYSTSIQENHQFFCDESLELNKDPDDPNNELKAAIKLLKELGMISFTLRSCHKIFNNNLKYIKNTSLNLPEELKKEMKSNKTLIDYMFTKAYYTEFNKGAETYQDIPTEIKTVSEIYDLIKYNEDRQFDSNYPKDDTKDTLLETINNSLEKCVIIEIDLFQLGGGDAKQNIYFKLTFFQKNLDNNNLDPVFKNDVARSNTRGVAFNGINIAEVPQTPYGQFYSYNTTSNFQSQSPSNIGSIVPADPRNQFSQDKVAGKLETFYDPNTNMWHAGNIQILARLLTDIDPFVCKLKERTEFRSVESKYNNNQDDVNHNSANPCGEVFLQSTYFSGNQLKITVFHKENFHFGTMRFFKKMYITNI
jgi:hypothetical protein